MTEETIPNFNVIGEPISIDSLANVPKPDSIDVIAPVKDATLEILSAKVDSDSDNNFYRITGLVLKVISCPKEDLIGRKFVHQGDFLNDSIFIKIDNEKKDSDWWKDPARYANLKALMEATGCAILDPDDVKTSLAGKQFIGNVVQVPNTRKNEKTNTYEEDGTFNNAVRNFRPVL